MTFGHVSVLLNETVGAVVHDKNGIYVDCTLGGGGHARAMGERLSERGMIVGLDRDTDARSAATERLKGLDCEVKIISANFRDLKSALAAEGIESADGFVFDLGVSSYQLDTPERGFSYMNDGPLDMRMNRESGLTAADVVNGYEEEELTRILKAYGEERWAKRIAAFVSEARKAHPIETTGELVGIIKKAIPADARREGPHPAKRTFQALRIEVNDELGILKESIEDAIGMLRPGGRIGVITFHSLEDRIVKRIFKELSTGCICPPEIPVCVCNHRASIRVTGKAIEPTAEEVGLNPRARSAKLRTAEKII